MSRIYKTAKGKTVDMDKIKLANETSIAVGNMKVNARGDLIGSNGQIAAGRNQVMDRVYAVDPPSYTPANTAQREIEMQNNKAKELHNLANNLVTPSLAEPTVEESSTAPTAPVGRGSLASAVAKTVSVVQEKIPDPRTPKGPTRI